jgi:hypothetical protein
MKHIIATAFFFLSFFSSYAQISAGDIAFTGINTSGTDGFSFIVLKDVPANTEIRFTDGGWKSGGGFRCHETDLSWNSGGTVIPAGTQVTLTASPSASHGSFTAYNISVTCNATAATFLELATLAEQIFAYTGTFASPNLLAAIDISNAWDADATDAQTSANPNIANGHNICLQTTYDNAVYSASVSGSQSQVLAALNNPSSWTTTNSNVSLPASGVVLPVEWGKISVKSANKSCLVVWETQSEKNVEKFNIQRATTNQDFKTIGEVGSLYGTTSGVSSYNFEDKTPSVGVNYYRLQQIDQSGKASLSSVFSVLVGSSSAFTLTPTVATESVFLRSELNQESRYDILNIFGQIVEKGTFLGQKQLIINPLQAGIYFVRVGDLTLKFVKN